MKQIFFTVLVAAAMTTSAAESGGQYFKTIGTGNPAGMSPNGRYAVGTSSFNDFESFLYDSDSDKLMWLTECDMLNPDFDYDISGRFYAVNDDGVIVGACKDGENTIKMEDVFGSVEEPLMSAAIWKDGEMTKLGYGDFKLEDFLNPGDGSAAAAITADGKKVVGYVMRGMSAYFTPVGWDYDDATGEWKYRRYAMPAKATDGEVGSISADGSIAVGYVKIGMCHLPVNWTSPDVCVPIELTAEDAAIYGTDYNWNYAYSVSPNGKYILFALNNTIPCVYSVDEKKYEKVGVFPGAHSLSVRGISDAGDTAGSFVSGDFFSGINYEAFWYSYENRVMAPFDYFTDLYASEIEQLPAFGSSIIRTISADGAKFFGSSGGSMWMLSTDKERIVLPESVNGVVADNSDLGEITIRWSEIGRVPEGFTLKCYNVFIDGEKCGEVGIGSPLEFVADGIEPGVREVEIEQEFYTGENKIIRSPKSIGVSVSVAETFNLPLFDDFQSTNLNLNSWTTGIEYGCEQDFLDWHIRETADINRSTYALTNIVTNTEPYSTYAATRYLDAKDMKSLYLTFAIEMMYANRDDWDLTGDWLALEISVDDKEWTSLKLYSAKEMDAGRWVYEKVDLSDIASGHRFKLRFRSFGDARAQVIWYIDNFKVGFDDFCKSPEGLRADVKNGKVHLEWKNELGAYELGYFENSPSMYELGIGDEGKPFVVANSFDAEQLAAHVGRYITSVTTFLYDDPWLEESIPTSSSIMIFADNELVYEQEFDAPGTPFAFTVKLDHAVEIESGKEYKIAMKIYDYDPRQTPIYYQVTNDFIQWKSDLYSQDGGVTWKSLKDYYSDQEGIEEYGLCVWPMRANVTDESEIYDNYFLDDTIAGYNIYRNGERINSEMCYPVHMNYVDESPCEVSEYEVVAFYTNGQSSLPSSPCMVKMSSVDRIIDNSLQFDVEITEDSIIVNSDVDKVEVYSIDGKLMAASAEGRVNKNNIPKGLYIIRIVNGGESRSGRVLVR